MKKCIEELNPIMNQTRLAELLKLPLNVIRFLRKEKIIKSERVGMNYVFDEKSVEQFRESFDVEDYLTVGECKRKLQKYEFYSEYLYNNFFYNDLRIYITVKKLIKGGYDIPDEYRLSVKKFGTTQYISRKSFAKTLNWLRNVYHKLHPRQKEDFVLFPQAVAFLETGTTSTIRNMKGKRSNRGLTLIKRLDEQMLEMA
jgi:hypothetical protein